MKILDNIFFQNQLWRLILAVICFSLIFFVGIPRAIKEMKQEQIENDRYQLISKNDSTIINGKIHSLFMERNCTFITLTNGEEKAIAWAYNYSYEPSYMGDFLQRGDSIYKKSYSDTLYVYREHETYFFVLYQRIGIKSD